jgi:hypothetical protein
MSYTRDYLEKSAGVEELRGIMRSLGGTPRLLNKTQLIDAILKLQTGESLPEEQNNNKRGRKPRDFKKNFGDDYTPDNFDDTDVEVKKKLNTLTKAFLILKLL